MTTVKCLADASGKSSGKAISNQGGFTHRTPTRPVARRVYKQGGFVVTLPLPFPDQTADVSAGSSWRAINPEEGRGKGTCPCPARTTGNTRRRQDPPPHRLGSRELRRPRRGFSRCGSRSTAYAVPVAERSSRPRRKTPEPKAGVHSTASPPRQRAVLTRSSRPMIPAFPPFASHWPPLLRITHFSQKGARLKYMGIA